MKKIIIMMILVVSTLFSQNIKVDSIGINLGTSWIKSKQTDQRGTIAFAHIPEESYINLEIYSLINGIFTDKDWKVTINSVVNINNDFNNIIFLAGVNKYFMFKKYNIYLGALAGAGVLEWKYNPLNSSDTSNTSVKSAVAALQVGSEYKLSDNYLLSINAKYYVHNYKTTIKTIGVNETFIYHKDSQSISFGFRFLF